ncbi:MAG TPA: hypothetical protein VHV31_02860 [Nitrolancea sp.]|nr:hypothetical protein [Nitrolancea sp.]
MDCVDDVVAVGVTGVGVAVAVTVAACVAVASEVVAVAAVVDVALGSVVAVVAVVLDDVALETLVAWPEKSEALEVGVFDVCDVGVLCWITADCVVACAVASVW